MKLLTLALLAASSAFAADPAIHGTLQFKALTWKAECTQAPSICAVPVANGDAQTFEIVLADVTEPGQAIPVQQDFSWGEYKGTLTIYSIYPYANTGLPPYTQIQITLSAPVAMFCMESVRWREPADIPTLICGGYDKNTQYGVTLLQSSTSKSSSTGQ